MDIIHCVGESTYNRMTDEYAAIAAKLPPLTVLHGYINDLLKKCADTGQAPYEKGDRHIWYQEFPKELSIETVRNAERKSGMRALSSQARRH